MNAKTKKKTKARQFIVIVDCLMSINYECKDPLAAYPLPTLLPLLQTIIWNHCYKLWFDISTEQLASGCTIGKVEIVEYLISKRINIVYLEKTNADTSGIPSAFSAFIVTKYLGVITETIKSASGLKFKSCAYSWDVIVFIVVFPAFGQVVF